MYLDDRFSVSCREIASTYLPVSKSNLIKFYPKFESLKIRALVQIRLDYMETAPTYLEDGTHTDTTNHASPPAFDQRIRQLLQHLTSKSLFMFQPVPPLDDSLLIVEGGDARQTLALEELKRSSTPSRHKGDLVLHVKLCGGSRRVTPPDDALVSSSSGLCNGIQHSLGPLGEVVELEHTGGAVPHDSLGGQDLLPAPTDVSSRQHIITTTLSRGSTPLFGRGFGGGCLWGEGRLDAGLCAWLISSVPT